MKRRTFLGQAAAVAALPLTSARAATVEKVDVVVIGAGLSGLRAAALLADTGAKVVILEGRNRMGGRVLSLDHVNASPEAGANTMLAAYGRTLDLVNGLGLTLVDNAARPMAKPPILHLGGETTTIAEWKDSSRNPFQAARRAIAPSGVVRQEVARFNPLTTTDGWCDPVNAPHDVSMTAFLGGLGYTPAEIRLAHDVNPAYGRASGEVSLLNWMYVDAFFKAQRAAGSAERAVKGGNSRLIEAMAKGLKAEVRLGKTVTAISSDAAGALVICADRTRIRADHVVCSMPLPPMRKVAFDPPLPPLHRKAVFEAPHQMITQTHLEVSEPFWDQDGLAADMWTDTPLGVLTSIRGGDSPAEVTSLTAWARGDTAAALDRLPEAEARRRVVAELERLRPAAKGKVRAAGFQSWQNDPFTEGDWVVWAPGQATTLPQACGKAHGRIHFCGEHTALSARGMEGALESGERAALEILAP